MPLQYLLQLIQHKNLKSDTFSIVILQYVHSKSDRDLTATMTPANVFPFDLMQPNNVIYMVARYLLIVNSWYYKTLSSLCVLTQNVNMVFPCYQKYDCIAIIFTTMHRLPLDCWFHFALLTFIVLFWSMLEIMHW